MPNAELPPYRRGLSIASRVTDEENEIPAGSSTPQPAAVGLPDDSSMSQVDIGRLERALRAADAAGDVQAAQVLARAIRQQQPNEQVTRQSAPEQRSPVQELGRQIALTGRDGLEGVGDLVAVPANALAGLLNLGLHALGSDYRFGEQSQAFSNALDQAGVAKPETETEQFANKAARRMASAGASMGIGALLSGAPGATGQIANTLASNPVVQGVSAVTGPAAAEVTRQAGGGPVAQTVADLAGSLAPGLISAGTQELVRRNLRGGEPGRQNVQSNINTFSRVGTVPTVGQATEGRVARAAESMLARSPGGAGPVIRKAESQADELSAAIEKRAAQLMRRTSGEQAGRAITKGVNGEGGFVESFKVKQGELYDQLDQFIPKDKPVDVSNTRKALQDLNVNIENAPAISKFFQNSKLGSIQGALESDVSKGSTLTNSPDLGRLPYEALKKLRTLVGNEIADSWAGSDIPRSKWNALYAALSTDLKVAATSQGKGAVQAWNRANNYTRAGMQRLDAISSVIEKNGGPEKVFQAATSGTREGATTLRAVMQSLPEEGQKTLTATVLRRLGAAKPGSQNAAGDQFSTETFLTNWNNLSPEAKRVLFDRFGPTFRGDMDRVAKVAANLREGSQVFRNPSGTAQATAQAATASAFAVSVLMGQFGPASGIAASVTGANLISRLMVNPRFVRWLARSTTLPRGTFSTQLSALASQARATGDRDLALAAAVLEKGPGDEDQKQQRRQQ